MSSKHIVVLVVLTGLCAVGSWAGKIYFIQSTDTIKVNGQSVLGTAATYEAVVLFPSCNNQRGVVFNEWQAFGEDKYMDAGTNLSCGFFFNVGPQICSEISLSPDQFHHLAYVYDGSEERFYVGGTLVTNTA